jgi:hypothetical protein
MRLKYNYIGRGIRRLFRIITGKAKQNKLLEEVKPGDNLWMLCNRGLVSVYVADVEKVKETIDGIISLRIGYETEKDTRYTVVDIPPEDTNKTWTDLGITTDYNIALKLETRRMVNSMRMKNTYVRNRYQKLLRKNDDSYFAHSPFYFCDYC